MSSSPKPSTGCTCAGPGYCMRHHLAKNATWFRLCSEEPDYFQAWEECRGPGQLLPRGVPRLASPRGPGMVLRKMLGSCGHYPFVRVMDRLGTDGCEEHMPELVLAVLAHKDKFAIRLDARGVERAIMSAIKESRRLEVERGSEVGIRGDDGAGAAG